MRSPAYTGQQERREGRLLFGAGAAGPAGPAPVRDQRACHLRGAGRPAVGQPAADLGGGPQGGWAAGCPTARSAAQLRQRWRWRRAVTAADRGPAGAPRHVDDGKVRAPLRRPGAEGQRRDRWGDQPSAGRQIDHPENQGIPAPAIHPRSPPAWHGPGQAGPCRSRSWDAGCQAARIRVKASSRKRCAASPV